MFTTEELLVKYEELLLEIVRILEIEKEHEGTEHMMPPSQMLDKIAGMTHELPKIRERIYGK